MKNIVFTLFLLIFSLFWVSEAAAQKKEAAALLSQAKEQMARQNYQAANNSFREMLELKAVLPTEMCYYFASTLYMLGQYENSLRFTEKYQELAGAGGEFYKDSKKLKDLLQEKMEIIRQCSLCDSKGYVLAPCPNCESKGELRKSCSLCYGREKVKCLSCDGEGVVIEKNHFGQNTYNTCQKCEGKGIQICPKCDGAGVLVQDCLYCQGSGQIPTASLCAHPANKLP